MRQGSIISEVWSSDPGSTELTTACRSTCPIVVSSSFRTENAKPLLAARDPFDGCMHGPVVGRVERVLPAGLARRSDESQVVDIERELAVRFQVIEDDVDVRQAA